jgi:hypothetical protein
MEVEEVTADEKNLKDLRAEKYLSMVALEMPLILPSIFPSWAVPEAELLKVTGLSPSEMVPPEATLRV